MKKKLKKTMAGVASLSLVLALAFSMPFPAYADKTEGIAANLEPASVSYTVTYQNGSATGELTAYEGDTYGDVLSGINLTGRHWCIYGSNEPLDLTTEITGDVRVVSKTCTAGEAVKENEADATCISYATYDSVTYCVKCGAELSRETVTGNEYAAHTYDNGEITKIATVNEAGEITYTCTVCGATKTEEYQAQTCTLTYRDGSNRGTVTVVVGVTTYQEALDSAKQTWRENCHWRKYGGDQSLIDLTETISGDITIATSKCTEETVEGKAATCTETGLTDGTKCSVCGAILTAQAEIPATGHTAGEAVKENEVAATCTEDGSYDSVVYCTVCEEEISRQTVTVEATGHTEETVEGKAATCTEAGLTDGVKCSVCGTILTAQEEIPATGHTAGEAVIENYVAATATEDGSYDSVVYCAVCGAELSREKAIINATGTGTTTVTVSAGTYTIGSAAGATITCDGNMNQLTGVQVNGTSLNSSNYTVAAASNGFTVTILSSYLDTLSAGKYTVTLMFMDDAENDYSGSVTLTVAAGSTTDPSDNTSGGTGATDPTDNTDGTGGTASTTGTGSGTTSATGSTGTTGTTDTTDTTNGTVTTTSTITDSASTSTVKTGVEDNLVFYVMAIILGMGVAVPVMVKRRKMQ